MTLQSAVGPVYFSDHPFGLILLLSLSIVRTMALVSSFPKENRPIAKEIDLLSRRERLEVYLKR